MSLEYLDWDDLKIFLQAARTRTVTGTARLLGISHSTISRRLSRLEFSVGSSLFERGRDGIVLTTAGQIVLKRAEEIETGINGLRTDMSHRNTVSGSVRLATMEGIASLYLAPRLSALTDRYPDLVLELVTSPQAVRVARREADLFLSFFKPEGLGFQTECIGSFTTRLYASRSYIDVHGEPATAEELAGHRFIGYVDELVQLDAVRWLEELVPTPQLVVLSNSMIVQMQAAVGGAGIVALPAFAHFAAGVLVPILPGLGGERMLWLSVHQDMANLSRIRATSRFLKHLIREDQEALNVR